MMNNLANQISHFKHEIEKTAFFEVVGNVSRINGVLIEVKGLNAPIGAVCEIDNDGRRIMAQVVGFEEDILFLMPEHATHGIQPHDPVTLKSKELFVPVGHALLGRVVDGSGVPLDDEGDLAGAEWVSLSTTAINPLHRKPISEPLDVGVRALNSLLTIGVGQRIGLFAGSGVGKSVLLGMLTQFAEADMIVLGLIGERGREVQEFIRDHIGAAKHKSVVVAAPADESPYHRLQGAFYATRIAEYFRAQGKTVLLLMDSLTRVAQAKRELALALGEMPASRGFPPSVFQTLPQLVERAGNDRQGGSITALYTVLAEGDDLQDPVVDCARAILDGHIVLSRQLAERAHYPAIDIEASISRVMNKVLPKSALEKAKKLRILLSHYAANEDFIKLGVYQEGKDQLLDEAIKKMPKIKAFLQQADDEKVTLEACSAKLDEILK